jgi:hypothetical protein
MDILCPKCGEPWDHDCLHDEVEARGLDATYDQIAGEFRRRGCAALIASVGSTECSRLTVERESAGPSSVKRLVNGPRNQDAMAAHMIYEVLGDDMDGAASMLDDLGL